LLVLGLESHRSMVPHPLKNYIYQVNNVDPPCKSNISNLSIISHEGVVDLAAQLVVGVGFIPLYALIFTSLQTPQ